MKQILCFGDSNTYGLIPKTTQRYPFEIRWTGRLAQKLGFQEFNVIEEGLCGRTTIFDDPLRDGRCGVKLLPTILETHSPLDMTIIMLGTNDCKSVYGASAELIGKGISRLIGQVRNYAKDSKILIISPIHLGEKIWECDAEFSDESVEVSRRIADVYKQICDEENVFFLNAASVEYPSDTDREHMDEEGHKRLAEAVFKIIKEVI